MTTRYRWFVFLVCWLAGAFAGMNSSLFSVLLPQAIADITLQTDKGLISQYGSYILASFLGGWMAGGILLGMVSDRIGRVKTLAISIALYAISTSIAGLSSSIWELMATRFLAGVGVGGTMVGISVFLAETWTSASKSMAIAALITSYQAGVFMAGFLAQLIPDWRLAFAGGILPALLVVPIFFYFCEPLSRAGGKQTSQFGMEKNLVLGAIIFGSLLIGYWASLSWIPTWIHDLLGDSAQGHEKNVSVMVNGLGAILGCFVSGMLADRYGRRLIVAFSFAGAFTASWWMFLTAEQFSNTLYLWCALLGFFVGVAQGVMYIYLSELFPAERRATCVGLCLNLGRAITCAAIFFIGPIVSAFGGYEQALCVFALLYLVGAAAVYFVPETNLRQLTNS